MLTTFIIVSFITWIVGFFINGFTLYNVLIIVPTVMFSLRKVGIHCSMGSIIGAELLMLFFSIMWRLIFHKFELLRFILALIVRIIFICIVVYDETMFVYVSEEKKHD